MIIAFMGNDGSGKTTIAKETVNFFKQLGFECTYKHEYEYLTLKYLFKLVGKKKLEQSRKDLFSGNTKSLKYTVWPVLVWADLLFQFVYYKFKKRKAIRILDRYPYDQYLSFKHSGATTRFIEWLYMHFPDPDLGIVLAVEPQLAFERKRATHSYSLAFYKKQTEEYLDLAKKLRLPVLFTNEELQESLRKIIAAFMSNPKLSRKILRQGFQNRMIYHVMKKYDLLREDNLQPLPFLQDFSHRKGMAVRSIQVLREILKNIEVENYGVIKTVDDFEFVGNDIDVLTTFTNVEKIYSEISRYGGLERKYPIQKVLFNKRKDSGKIDIFVENGIKLDIHAYVGWENIVFIGFNELKDFIEEKTIFGNNCRVINERANCVIIAAHALEKGFVTLEEFSFLQRYLVRDFVEKNFGSFSSSLSKYIMWLYDLLRNPPKQFPVFVPPGIVLKSYLHITAEDGDERFWRLKAFTRLVPLIIFWNARYRLTSRLPFELREPKLPLQIKEETQ